MRNFVLFLLSIVLCFTVEAQRPSSSSSTRSGGSVSHSTSVSHQSTSRSSSVSHTSSSRTYTPSRSASVSHSQTRSSSSVSHSSTPSSRGYNMSAQKPSRTSSKPRTTQQRDNRPSNVSNAPVTHSMGHHNDPTHNPGHNPGQPHHVPHGMHPHPPMHHPVHHRHIHMHYTPVACWLMHDYYWHGYWAYAHTYPYNDVVIYVNNNNNNNELIAMACDELYVYSIYYDRWENRKYFTITDNNDNMFVKTEIGRRYTTLLIGDGGVWAFKKNDKDPLFFSYQDGMLYKYEQD